MASAFTIRRRSFLAKGRKLNVHREPRQQSIGPHRHEFFEIVVVLSGSAVHVTGDYRHRIEGGDTLVLHPRRIHGYEKCQSLNIVNVLVRDDVLARIGRSLGDQPGFQSLFLLESRRWNRTEYSSRLHLRPSDLERVEEWVTRMEEETRRSAHAVHLVQEACLALVIDLLCRRYEQQRGPSRRRPVPTTTHRLGHLLSWIEQNLHCPLRIDQLAAQAGMSPRSFHRHFRAALQITPQAYVARARIRRAAELLSAPQDQRTVMEVGQACGFNDSNYFTRCFRRSTGLSPRAYRRRETMPH